MFFTVLLKRYWTDDYQFQFLGNKMLSTLFVQNPNPKRMMSYPMDHGVLSLCRLVSGLVSVGKLRKPMCIPSYTLHMPFMCHTFRPLLLVYFSAAVEKISTGQPGLCSGTVIYFRRGLFKFLTMSCCRKAPYYLCRQLF